MAKFQAGDHVIINCDPRSEFHGLCGVVALPSMGDAHYALVVLDVPVQLDGADRYDWAVPKRELVLDHGAERSELTEERVTSVVREVGGILEALERLEKGEV